MLSKNREKCPQKSKFLVIFGTAAELEYSVGTGAEHVVNNNSQLPPPHMFLMILCLKASTHLEETGRLTRRVFFPLANYIWKISRNATHFVTLPLGLFQLTFFVDFGDNRNFRVYFWFRTERFLKLLTFEDFSQTFEKCKILIIRKNSSGGQNGTFLNTFENVLS